MIKVASLFSQLLQHVPRSDFQCLVDNFFGILDSNVIS